MWWAVPIGGCLGVVPAVPEVGSCRWNYAWSSINGAGNIHKAWSKCINRGVG